MIRIAISVRGVRGDSPDGSVGYENETKERGERYVWLAPKVVDRLGAMRGPSEFSGGAGSCATPLAAPQRDGRAMRAHVSHRLVVEAQ